MDPYKKQLAVIGAGAGTGILVPTLIAKYLDPQYPSIFGFRPSVLIPIATGGIGLIAAFFTKLIKKDNVNTFIMAYSVPAIIYGILQYIWPCAYAMTSRAAPMKTVATQGYYTQVNNPWYVTSKVPGYEGTGLGRVSSGVIIA